MSKSTCPLEYSRQSIKGIFFCKNTASKEDCRKLVQDLGCTILLEKEQRLTIQTTRSRLKELKAKYLAPEDDLAQISSRLKRHFDGILIGGSVR